MPGAAFVIAELHRRRRVQEFCKISHLHFTPMSFSWINLLERSYTHQEHRAGRP
jgi:hypothetical protein